MLRICSFVLICLSTLPALSQNASSTTADLMKQAEAAYQANHFSESASLYTRALPLVQDSDRAGVEYNLACSQALAGDRTSALDTLDHAVEDGYTDRKDTEADKDLVSLHADSRWQPILDRMTTFTAQQNARWGDAAFATPSAANIPNADKLAGARRALGSSQVWLCQLLARPTA